MNDVKEICELTLDGPAPPLPGAAETIAMVRRAARKRAHMMLGSSALILVVAATGAVALTRSAPSAALTPAAIPSATTAPPPVLSTTLPTAIQRAAHGRAITRILVAAAPDGYRATPDHTASGPENTWVMFRAHVAGYAGLTSVLLTASGGQGDLRAFIYADGKPGPTGDVCSATTTAYLVATTYLTVTDNDRVNFPCEAVMIDGVAIRVDTQHDPHLGEVKTATRFLDGGILQVVAEQGVPDFPDSGPLPPDARSQPGLGTTSPHKPPLGSQPFTSAQLAAIAANPGLLP